MLRLIRAELLRNRLVRVDVGQRVHAADRDDLVVALIVIEVRRLLRRHHDVVPRLRGRDAALLTTPAHHRRARREPALEDLVPADEAPPPLREPSVDARDEPALKLLLVPQSELLHSRLCRWTLLPFALRALVASDVDELRRKERQDFVEHVLDEGEDVVADAEDVFADAPVRLDLVLRLGVAELGICRDRSERMTGHLDLGYDG